MVGGGATGPLLRTVYNVWWSTACGTVDLSMCLQQQTQLQWHWYFTEGLLCLPARCMDIKHTWGPVWSHQTGAFIRPSNAIDCTHEVYQCWCTHSCTRACITNHFSALTDTAASASAILLQCWCTHLSRSSPYHVWSIRDLPRVSIPLVFNLH
jgi:hypothetical protein